MRKVLLLFIVSLMLVGVVSALNVCNYNGQYITQTTYDSISWDKLSALEYGFITKNVSIDKNRNIIRYNFEICRPIKMQNTIYFKIQKKPIVQTYSLMPFDNCYNNWMVNGTKMTKTECVNYFKENIVKVRMNNEFNRMKLSLMRMKTQVNKVITSGEMI